MAGLGSALNKAVAVQVRKGRLELGVSQEQLAALCQLDRTYISSIERNRRNVSLETLGRLVEALRLDPRTFLANLADLVEGPDDAVQIRP